MENTNIYWPGPDLAAQSAAPDMQSGWDGCQFDDTQEAEAQHEISPPRPTQAWNLVCLYAGCTFITPFEHDLQSHYTWHFGPMSALPSEQDEPSVGSHAEDVANDKPTDADELRYVEHVIRDLTRSEKMLVIDAPLSLIQKFYQRSLDGTPYDKRDETLLIIGLLQHGLQLSIVHHKPRSVHLSDQIFIIVMLTVAPTNPNDGQTWNDTSRQATAQKRRSIPAAFLAANVVAKTGSLAKTS
ncbi:MAG: hypothetical protein Q9213_005261 [Squamulea squamosa]